MASVGAASCNPYRAAGFPSVGKPQARLDPQLWNSISIPNQCHLIHSNLSTQSFGLVVRDILAEHSNWSVAITHTEAAPVPLPPSCHGRVTRSRWNVACSAANADTPDFAAACTSLLDLDPKVPLPPEHKLARWFTPHLGPVSASAQRRALTPRSALGLCYDAHFAPLRPPGLPSQLHLGELIAGPNDTWDWDSSRGVVPLEDWITVLATGGAGTCSAGVESQLTPIPVSSYSNAETLARAPLRRQVIQQLRPE